MRTYDARNRVSTLTFPDANGNQSWTYTPDGLPASVTTYNDAGASSVVNSYTYNKRRLPTGETLQADTNTWTVGYAYDANGALSTLTYPDSLSVDYAPNALGQPTQVGSYATNVSYAPNGAIAGFSYGNGIVHSLAQNARGFPAVSKDVDGPTAIHQDEYTYDEMGNVVFIIDGVGPTFIGDRDMVYDALDRLTDVVSPMYGTIGAHYSYDVLDNLTSVTAPSTAADGTHAYCYDEHWRLTNVKAGTCSGGTVIGLGYDVQGNLSNKSGVTYAFDYGNRLRAGGPETYRYDAHGRRVRSTSSAGLIYSLYTQSGQLLFQRDERNNKRRQYIYLNGSLVAEHDRPLVGSTVTVTYQHTDALGSPVATTNSAKVVLQRSEYEPYGYLLNRPMEDGPGYTGHVTDAATGLIYMQQRYLDARIPRFLSADAVTALSDPINAFHRYRYANNNPYRFTDPDGRDPVDDDPNHRPGRGPATDPPPPPPPPRTLRDTVKERDLLRRGQLQKYYESRARRGDKYAALAGDALSNRGFLGKAANMWLFTQVVFSSEQQQKRILNGGTYIDFVKEVNSGIANAHSNAVNSDVIGSPGLLSYNQISEYHENYFQSLGLPRNTFGGSFLFSVRTSYWCIQCDLQQ